MASLAYSDSRWRRGGGASGSRRPFLFREITRCDPQFLLREGFCRPRHDFIASVSTLEVAQLFQEVIFRLTRDERNGCHSAYAVHAVAFVANAQLGAEFSIRARIWDTLSGICRRGQNDQNADNNLCTQEFPFSLACCRRIIAYKSGRRGVFRGTPLWDRRRHPDRSGLQPCAIGAACSCARFHATAARNVRQLDPPWAQPPCGSAVVVAERPPMRSRR